MKTRPDSGIYVFPVWIIFCFVLSFTIALTAQTANKKPGPCIIVIHSKSENYSLLGVPFKHEFKTEGILYQVKDSSLLICRDIFSGNFRSFPNNKLNLEEIPVKGIWTLELRRKNVIGKNALIGALTGIVVGVGSGYLPKKENSGAVQYLPKEKAIIRGIILGITGIIAGEAIGSALTIRIPINGDAQVFKNNKTILQKHSAINMIKTNTQQKPEADNQKSP
jgi:hypothetical protein